MTSRTLLVAGCIMSALIRPSQAAAPSLTFSALFGSWKVERMVGATEITGDDQSARAGLGMTITISALEIREPSGPNCKPRNPTIMEVDTEAKLESDYGTKATGLYLPAGTMKPRMPFLEAGCASAFILDRNTLLWTLANGYIYTVKRQ